MCHPDEGQCPEEGSVTQWGVVINLTVLQILRRYAPQDDTEGGGQCFSQDDMEGDGQCFSQDEGRVGGHSLPHDDK